MQVILVHHKSRLQRSLKTLRSLGSKLDKKTSDRIWDLASAIKGKLLGYSGNLDMNEAIKDYPAIYRKMHETVCCPTETSTSWKRYIWCLSTPRPPNNTLIFKAVELKNMIHSVQMVHFDSVSVSLGDVVTQGQKLGGYGYNRQFNRRTRSHDHRSPRMGESNRALGNRKCFSDGRNKRTNHGIHRKYGIPASQTW